MTEQTTHKFRVGETYATRAICDHDTIFSFEILGRTAQTVTIKAHGKIVKRGIGLRDGVEQFRPFGAYSMAAVITADKTLAAVEA